ncbi:PaaI family thioesterase [Betaproteobacteria bacterium PRO7]|jgi:uncharacterized protein (TIGR00369 family)|nr:PaaI family thioesterase [Burkholderiaceae bacterium]MDL1861693.1 PaaI family thioesterase [Betaproteobacteria bacterium PRO7]GIL06485.1 MAG: hypothetical protein BroJett031_30050 [Betaproteobacteria bacterium]
MAAGPELDRRALLERGFADAPFVHGNGIRLADIGAGWCEASVDVQPHHLQQTGVVHAGLLTTLADHCAGAAAFTQAGPTAQVLTTNLNVSLLRAARGQRLRCRAEVVRAGRQVSFVEASVWASDGDGETLVARAMATLAVARPA